MDDDLVAAVKARTIAGAVLDVFRHRAAARRASLLGHRRASSCCRISAGSIRSATGVVAELFVDNLRRFLAGQPLLHAVDRQRGY